MALPKGEYCVTFAYTEPDDSIIPYDAPGKKYFKHYISWKKEAYVPPQDDPTGDSPEVAPPNEPSDDGSEGGSAEPTDTSDPSQQPDDKGGDLPAPGELVTFKGNTYTAIRYNVGSNTGIMSSYQSAWQNFTHLPKETTIPADTWIKVSIPMNQIWLSKKITTNNYTNIDVNEYQGYTDNGGRDGWLYSYKEVDRIYLNAQQESYAPDTNPTVFLIDHVTIRKSTL